MLPLDRRHLRWALLGNAAFSGALALALTVPPEAVGSWLGVSGYPLLVGLGLALFAFAGARALGGRSGAIHT